MQPVTVFLVCAGLSAGCGGGDTKAARAKPTAKRTPKKKKAPVQPAIRAPMPSLEDAEIERPGALVRVFRRPITSGVILVKDERVTDAAGAAERTDELVAQGWKRWPPMPAPELASALAEPHPGLADCPYLMPASDLPRDLLTAPGRTVTCFRTVADLEQALDREAVIQYHQGQAVPCQELRAITIRDLREPRIRELRDQCRRMGITVTPRGTKAESHREVIRRSKRNRTAAKVINRH